MLCALCLQYPHLAWVGVLLLGVTIAAPVAVGGIILARNHWLVVVLRYCLSVAALQRDTGLSFAGVRWPPLRAALGWVLSGVLGVVGLVVAVYLSACYVVSFILGVFELLSCYVFECGFAAAAGGVWCSCFGCCRLWMCLVGLLLLLGVASDRITKPVASNTC